MEYIRKNYILIVLISFLLIGTSNASEDLHQKNNVNYFDYRDVSRVMKDDYTWQCPYVISDEKYNTDISKESPLVYLFEVDEKRLYMKVFSRLIRMDIKIHDATHFVYFNQESQIEVTIKINKKYNFSEYDETHDRNVSLKIKSINGVESFSAVGQSCGI